MKINEPIGNSAYAPLFIRCTLGGYMIMGGLMKVRDIAGYIHQVRGYHVLPDHLATLYGIITPYLEITSGALLVVGIWTTLAACLAALLLAAYVAATGIFPNTHSLFNKDIILVAAAVSLLYSGAGAFSIDRFRKSG